jgi:hypothetical protein
MLCLVKPDVACSTDLWIACSTDLWIACSTDWWIALASDLLENVGLMRGV